MRSKHYERRGDPGIQSMQHLQARQICKQELVGCTRIPRDLKHSPTAGKQYQQYHGTQISSVSTVQDLCTATKKKHAFELPGIKRLGTACSSTNQKTAGMKCLSLWCAGVAQLVTLH